MSTDDNAWVTRKDAAALARCSEDAIKDTQKKHRLPTRTGDAGAALLSLDDLVRVGRVRAEDLAAAGTGAECAELARTMEQVSTLRTEVGRQSGRLAEREASLTCSASRSRRRTVRSKRCRPPSSVSRRAWPAGARHEPRRPGAAPGQPLCRTRPPVRPRAPVRR